MAAAGRGNYSIVEELVSMGADLEIHAANGWSAKDIAAYRNQNDTVALLESFKRSTQASQAQSLVEVGKEIHEVRLLLSMLESIDHITSLLCRFLVNNSQPSDYTNQRSTTRELIKT